MTPTPDNIVSVDFRRHLHIQPRENILDVGCGNGRHTIEACLWPCRAVGLDLSYEDLRRARYMLADLQRRGKASGHADFVVADAQHLPFRNGTFDKVICTETLEHVPDDRLAIRELHRVLRAGGDIAISVPNYWPEVLFWTLSWEYWHTPGGHVRIYKPGEMYRALTEGGIDLHTVRYRHSIQTAYWFLRCIFGKDREDFVLTTLFFKFINWHHRARLRLLEFLEATANLVMGKDMILYGRKPVDSTGRGDVAEAATAPGDAQR